jgi:hypothetical protein
MKIVLKLDTDNPIDLRTWLTLVAAPTRTSVGESEALTRLRASCRAVGGGKDYTLRAPVGEEPPPVDPEEDLGADDAPDPEKDTPVDVVLTAAGKKRRRRTKAEIEEARVAEAAALLSAQKPVSVPHGIPVDPSLLPGVPAPSAAAEKSDAAEPEADETGDPEVEEEDPFSDFGPSVAVVAEKSPFDRPSVEDATRKALFALQIMGPAGKSRVKQYMESYCIGAAGLPGLSDGDIARLLEEAQAVLDAVEP